LNLKAGKQAKEATAYAATREYLVAAMETFPGELWKDNYDLALEIHRERIQVEYLNGNFEESKLLIEISIEKAKSGIERSKFYMLLVEQYTMLGKYAEAIQTGQTALNLLGVDLPDRDFDRAVKAELAKFRTNLGDRQVGSLIDSPEMVDPVQKVVLDLLIKLQPPTYLTASRLADIIMVKSCNLCLEYGHTSKAASSYGHFGMLQSKLGNYQLSYELTLLGYQLSKRFNDKYSLSQTAVQLANFSLIWLKHIKESETLNLEALDAGLQSGMLQFVGFSMTHNLLNRIYQGRPLTPFLQEAFNILPFCQKTKNQWSVDCILGQKIVLANLLDQTHEKLYFACHEIDESDYLSEEKAGGNPNAICYYYIFKAQVLYLYEELQLALASTAKAQELMIFISGTIEVSTCNFYSSLICAALYLTASPEKQQEYWIQIEANQTQMRTWADYCPENFLHKYFLVSAEMARISGNWYEAVDLYDRAIELARESEFL
jgi:predicted ATPase